MCNKDRSADRQGADRRLFDPRNLRELVWNNVIHRGRNVIARRLERYEEDRFVNEKERSVLFVRTASVLYLFRGQRKVFFCQWTLVA